MIHPTAQIDPKARLGENVHVGAFAVIGEDVVIGDGSRIGPHCVVGGPTTLGRDCVVKAHATLGNDPQDKKYRGERSELIVGDRNTIFEFTTISRGTADGGGAGIVGHVELCDRVTVTAMSLVTRSITQPGEYSSALPAQEARAWRRTGARLRRLDELARKMDALLKDPR